MALDKISAIILLTMRITIILLWLCLAIAPSVQAQITNADMFDLKLNDIMQKGEQALIFKDGKKAAKYFKKALEINEEFCAALRGLGAAQLLMKDYESAAVQFGKVLRINPNFSRTLYYEYASTLYRLGDYTNALRYYEDFDLLKNLPVADFGYNGKAELTLEKMYMNTIAKDIRSCHIAMDSIKYQNIKSVENLGKGINSPADEYFPYLSNDQSLLFYTSKKNEHANENLFYAKSSRGKNWQSGQLVDNQFNTTENEGMATMVSDGKQVYFTACAREQVMGTCDIWQATLDGEKLSDAVPVKGYLNDMQWDSQASISCDGSVIYFASKREDGVGGTDIYVCKKMPDGRWGRPSNMGVPINTSGDEEAPFITNDGKVLYFSSTGHDGLGEQDIFMSRLGADGFWSKPTNLGPPVNSSYRELGFFLSADGKTGYFASDRAKGEGGLDIYNFELPEQLYAEPITFVEGFVKDSTYKLPVSTTVYFNNRLPLETDEEGRFFLCLPSKSDLSLQVSQLNYLPYARTFDIPASDNKKPIQLELLLKPEYTLEMLSERVKTKEPNTFTKEIAVYFDKDKFGLEADHEEALLTFLSECLNGMTMVKQVDIIGFADMSGSDSYNLQLSERRAKSVAVYLKEKGIRVDKVYLEAQGESVSKGNEAMDRRVELRLVLASR